MTGWLPVNDAPKDGTVVLFHVPGESLPFMGRADDYWNRAMWLEKATHWRPLPKPPTE